MNKNNKIQLMIELDNSSYYKYNESGVPTIVINAITKFGRYLIDNYLFREFI